MHCHCIQAYCVFTHAYSCGVGREETIRAAETKNTEVPFIAGAVIRIRVQNTASEFSAMLRAEVKRNIQSCPSLEILAHYLLL